MRVCNACGQARCVCSDANGPKQPYEEPCDHDFEADEDALEYVCIVPYCGHREPMPLDRLIT